MGVKFDLYCIKFFVDRITIFTFSNYSSMDSSVQIVHTAIGPIHAPRFSLIHHFATLRKGNAVPRVRASVLDLKVRHWFTN